MRAETAHIINQALDYEDTLGDLLDTCDHEDDVLPHEAAWAVDAMLYMATAHSYLREAGVV